MRWLLQLHRCLSGLSLLLLATDLAGMPVPTIAVRAVIMTTLIFYLGELLVLSIIALTHPRQVDIVYPVIMLIVTVVALKAVISGNIVLSGVPIIIMFVFGYIGGGGDESSRVYQGK